ncbi:MAG TPA: exodeoxyribonuclease III [Chromatiaceae bacterium]|nr:exodeoxyribonuclease III [Chromatiaceae bacterium]HIN83210.1 exodeoxyribonuclease III [Chromatiales bacterium]
MKIATWNVNSLKVRLPHVLDWLNNADPDILVLQETKTTDENFPREAIEEAGYQVAFSGQKTYNGVALISKHPITDVVTDVPDLDDPQRRILCATINDVRVLDLYVVNGSEVGSEKFEYKLRWLEAVTQYIKQQLDAHDRFVVLGDFNIAPADADVHDPEAWEGRILCSAPERDALQDMLDLGLNDCFRQFEQEDKSFSWWDYRAAGFRRNRGLRIDLILASNTLAQTCRACAIDKEPRGLERPSDHAPVYAEFE